MSTAAHQASLSFTISWSLLKLMSSESLMLSNISSSATPFSSCPQSFPDQGVFQWVSSNILASGGQNIGSFSISLPNEYSGLILFRIDWFDLLSVQGTPQESSPALQFESINSSVLSLLYGLTLTTVHDYWEDDSLYYILLLAKWCLCFLICCLGLS